MAYRLYVWIRSDLASMTPGKAAAQVAHAANQVHSFCNNEPEFQEWAGSALAERAAKGFTEPAEFYAGFGTTIVLDGGDEHAMNQLVYNDIVQTQTNGWYGAVMDPSYPVRDGKVTHGLNLLTCAWAFWDSECPVADTLLRKYKLYNGNHA